MKKGRKEPASSDVRSKIRSLWKSKEDKAEIERELHKYYLSCARSLFPILPQPESREGVVLGERYADGKLSLDELRAYDWYSEAAVFMIEYDEGSESVAQMIADVAAIPKPELAKLLNNIDNAFGSDPKEILVMAAYFADFAMIYPFMKRRGTVSPNYVPFLSPSLFDERFGAQSD